MSYRAGIEARAREAAEAARDEVLHAELRGLENLLAFCRDEPIPDKQQIDEIRRTIKWVRRQLRLPPSGEERRPSRPAEPEPEPIVEEPPDANVCWHWAKPRWGQSCRGDHIDDLLIIFGACRADGERWFWSAEAFEEAAYRASRIRAVGRAGPHQGTRGCGRARGRPAGRCAGERRSSGMDVAQALPARTADAARSARRSAGRDGRGAS